VSNLAEILETERESIKRLQGLGTDLDKKLATVEGELHLLQAEQDQLPENPHTTAETLAKNRHEIEKRVLLMQGITTDRGNVEKALLAARHREKKLCKEHFRKHVQPEKSGAIHKASRELANSIVQVLEGGLAKVQHIAQENRVFQVEGRKALETNRDADITCQRIAEMLEASMQHSLNMWKQVQKTVGE